MNTSKSVGGPDYWRRMVIVLSQNWFLGSSCPLFLGSSCEITQRKFNSLMQTTFLLSDLLSKLSELGTACSFNCSLYDLVLSSFASLFTVWLSLKRLWLRLNVNLCICCAWHNTAGFSPPLLSSLYFAQYYCWILMLLTETSKIVTCKVWSINMLEWSGCFNKCRFLGLPQTYWIWQSGEVPGNLHFKQIWQMIF